MSIENEILDNIISALNPEYGSQCNIRLVENKGAVYQSILVDALESSYRGAISSLLFARLKTDGKEWYISFNSNYSYLFSNAGVDYYEVKSDLGFVRIKINPFLALMNNSSEFSFVMQTIFNNLFSLEKFSCCSKYLECSDQKKCIHPDLIYALGCYYRKNLSDGKIFYGKNCNC